MDRREEKEQIIEKRKGEKEVSNTLINRVSQPVSQLISQSVRQLASQCISELVSQLISKESREVIVSGSKTEGAMLLMVSSSFGVDYAPIRASSFNASRGDRLFTFSSARKRMSKCT